MLGLNRLLTRKSFCACAEPAFLNFDPQVCFYRPCRCCFSVVVVVVVVVVVFVVVVVVVVVVMLLLLLLVLCFAGKSYPEVSCT